LKNNHTHEEWQKMGTEIQDIENRLKAFLLNPNYQKLMTARLTDTLIRAVENIERFKSKAEDRMFVELDPSRCDDCKYFNVFYSQTQFADVLDIVVDNYDSR